MNKENEGSDTTQADVERTLEMIRKISKFHSVTDQIVTVQKMTHFWKLLV